MDPDLLLQVPEPYKKLYQQHWSTIRYREEGRLKTVYHFPLFNDDDKEISDRLKEVTSNYSRDIKINVEFGFIVRHIVTMDRKFFHPSNNNMMFTNPRTVKIGETETFISEIEHEDAFEYSRKQRPNTSWKVDKIICVRFDVYNLSI